ncbi:uncharacterized protein LOC142334299 isoform X2 [Lycorma delicatula]|uniref:uncharacterized protein LOC142334299 isoform X1 n=1 Tax=Lycorma delicatula TaxID=130591 RepID=UPI003F519835
MDFLRLKSGYFRILVAFLCAVSLSSGRSRDLDFLYKKWRPLDLVRGLRALSVDPFDVFRSLEAVKDLESDEALDVMHDLDVRPITIYDALDDLGIEPLDAYFALKSWLTDPLLHPPGDVYHRVNASGDPTHPFLHILYKKTKGKDGKSKQDYNVQYVTSKEIERELKDIEKEYKKAINENKLKMSNFINKAKKIHSSFDNPKKVFKDFFGKRHFKEWKSLFPEAFKGLKDIYKNPLGFSLKKDDKKLNVSSGREKMYQHLDKGMRFGNKFTDPIFKSSEFRPRKKDAFRRFQDPTRYDTIQDETHVEEENVDGGEDGKKKTHHVKSYYDKKNNMYVECRQTEECARSGQGVVRKVQSHVRQFDPQSYQNYKRQQQQQHSQQQEEEYPQQSQQQQYHQQPQQQQYNQQPQQQQYHQQPQQQQYNQQPQQQQYQQPQQQYPQQSQHQQHPQQPQYQQHPQQPQHQQHPQQPQHQQPQQQNYQQQPPPHQQPNNPQQNYQDNYQQQPPPHQQPNNPQQNYQDQHEVFDYQQGKEENKHEPNENPTYNYW